MDNSLVDTLDTINADIAASFPEMSDTETAIRTLRVTLSAMTEALWEFGATGFDMPNDGVAGLCSGLIETLNWMLAKEILSDTWEGIEAAANGETL